MGRFAPFLDYLTQEPLALATEEAVREWYYENKMFKDLDNDRIVWKTSLEASDIPVIRVLFGNNLQHEVLLESERSHAGTHVSGSRS